MLTFYAGKMIEDAIKDVIEGVRVGCELLKDLKFADDQEMVVQSESELQTIFDGLRKTGKKYDMQITVKNTKVMRVFRDNTINITIA